MIEIGSGITIEEGITIGDIDVFADYLLGQNNEFYLISETGEFFTHE